METLLLILVALLTTPTTPTATTTQSGEKVIKVYGGTVDDVITIIR